VAIGSIDTLDDLAAAFGRKQWRRLRKATQTAEGAGTYHSLWKAAGFPAAGATPPTGDGAVPTNATTGAIPLVAPGGSRKLFLGLLSLQGGTAGRFTVYDRLWHNSGFSMNITTLQSIATPPTLTRPDALGAGVELWGEVYTAGGATGSTYTAIYTNQDGTGSRSATYVQPANALSVGQMVPFDLQAGDTGVRTVASLQLSVATGVAGDFGLVLLRPVASLALQTANIEQFRDFFQLGGPKIDTGACLAIQVLCSTTNTGDAHLDHYAIEN
jgi:hypothetical protein